MGAGILVGYFSNRKDAGRALRVLGRRRFLRTALVHKTADGDVHVWDPFLWRRGLAATLAAILFGVLAGSASLILDWSVPILGGALSPLILILASAMVGALVGGGWTRRSRYGVERRFIEEHARLLVSGETALLLQGPIKVMRLPVALLRDSGEIPPALFFLHPKRERLKGDVRSLGVPLTLAHLEEHAQRLASDHEVNPKPGRNTEPLDRLEQARRWLHQVCSDLSEASRLEQTATPSAEWILDNEYIIEGNAREVQRNLPRRYLQELPALASGPCQGLPRIYDLAMELISHTDLRLDRENILAFLKAYQSVRTLTIGELWAVPQMLRTALIESVRDLAARALTELREREIADFWATQAHYDQSARSEPALLGPGRACQNPTQPESLFWFSAGRSSL